MIFLQEEYSRSTRRAVRELDSQGRCIQHGASVGKHHGNSSDNGKRRSTGTAICWEHQQLITMRLIDAGS
jgi:hypothetical protein